MRNSVFLFLALLLFVPKAFSQAHPEAGTTDDKHGLVKWLTFEEAFELNKKQPKPFIIDIYTDWCGWCKHMVKTTYSNPGIANYINTFFYPVQFNAETKDTIEYLGTKYKNTGTSPKSPHELAIKFLGNNLSYPTTIFSCNNFQFTFNAAGFLDADKIEPLLIFCVENIYKNSSYDDFKKYFDLTFKNTNPSENKSRALNVNDAYKKYQKQNKKMLLFVNTNWCNGCKMMLQTSFTDSSIADYIDKKFYLVDLNAEIQDTILFGGNTYTKTGKYGNFHDFVLEKTGGSLTLPTLLIYNEKLDRVDAIPFYLPPESLKPILTFYGDDEYLKKSWTEFFEDYKKKKEGKTDDSKIKKEPKK